MRAYYVKQHIAHNSQTNSTFTKSKPKHDPATNPLKKLGYKKISTDEEHT